MRAVDVDACQPRGTGQKPTEGGEPERPTSRFLRRRRFIVDPGFQLRFVVSCLCSFAICLTILAIALFAPPLMELGLSEGFEAHKNSAAATVLFLHAHLWPAVLGCLVVVVLASIRLSHRIVGPLVRYRRNLRALARAEIPRSFRPRRRDLLTEDVQLLNHLTESLAGRLLSLQAASNHLTHLAEECSSAIEDTRLRDLVREARSLERALGEFEVR